MPAEKPVIEAGPLAVQEKDAPETFEVSGILVENAEQMVSERGIVVRSGVG